MQMETELKETIKELEKTKTALKVQAARCRKLVAAYTRQLAEREAELRSSRELKDKQLSSVLRALIELEARLKREQKSIRAQLAEKDNIINNQQLEIESLKARIEIAVVETRNQIKPTAIFVEEVEKNEHRECYVKPDLISSLGIEGDKHDSLSSDTASTRSCLGDTSDSDFTAPSSSPQMKGVLSVHNRSAFSPIYVRIGNRTGDQDEYQDNPVLQCVNQILLKDQEDFLEEQMSLRMRRAEEKTKLDSEMKKTGSLGDHSKGGKFAAKHNPPLPPKPNRISGMKRVEFALDKRRDIKPTTVEFHNPPMVLPPPQPPLSILDPMDHGQDNELYVISNSALDDDIVQHLQGRMVNGSGLDIALGNAQRLHSNLPNGLLHPNHKTKSKGLVNNINLFTSNGLFNHQLSPNKENSSKRSRHAEGKSSGNFSAMTPPKTGLVNTIKVASPVATLLTSGKAQESPLKANQVSPSVSQIVRRFEDLGIKKLEGAQGEGYTLDNCGQVVQVDSTADKESPPIANGSAQQNYDNNSINGNQTTETANTVSYDNFLEATGLSQKSIMTPSRMLSNHKSVLKPKDVKHRNKVKSAIVEKCVPAQVVGSTIKYWTEPYL
ncbi:hypothetical protein AAG570_008855 [Ranatra chinensis]|uniref:Uncharacterized protein n=1 Tax=Ranatra chinensis TaxID=642074 RepID=A0ABD0Z970_9HEMI